MRARKANPWWCLWALLIAALCAPSVRAELTIQITGGQEGALPIAVVPFKWQGPPGQQPDTDVAQIIRSDLERSGRFRALSPDSFLTRPAAGERVEFRSWRMLGADNLVVGSVEPAPGGQYMVEFQLYDVYRAQQMQGLSFRTRAEDLRRIAHHISDVIYKEILGERGAFDTRIAYVRATVEDGTRRYYLQVADWDGHNPQTIVRSKEPLMSPAWSPDGRRLAYVSFEGGHSQIYVQELASGQRKRVAAYKGINGAPAWSPDGHYLAVSLSRAGSPDIHVLDLRTGGLQRLTDHPAIDTEPTWSPDGRHIAFTSDRGGSPQVYRIPAGGGAPQRLTFKGDYNARPVYAPDGKTLAMVHRTDGVYRIATMDLDTQALRVQTDGRLDESPSYAPNGSMILYATEHRGQGVLAVTAVQGDTTQRLASQEGNVREPAWSPYGRP